MLYWMKPLPEADIDYEKYKPFISNNWFRQNFMYFVYLLQVFLVTLSISFGVWKFSNAFIKLIVFLMVYLVHELLHISVVWRYKFDTFRDFLLVEFQCKDEQDTFSFIYVNATFNIINYTNDNSFIF